jgi:hypothetical protein
VNETLEELVAPFDEPADWDDVLRRARRRRPGRSVVAAIVVALAAVAVAPTIAGLLRHDGVGLPAEADRSNVAVVLAPLNRKVILEAAPWKGHDGFCYEVMHLRAGCVPRKTFGALVLKPPLFGWTFDDRVRSGVATLLGGRRVPLTVKHFGGRMDVTLFFVRGRVPIPRLLKSVVLRDADGKTVLSVRTPTR